MAGTETTAAGQARDPEVLEEYYAGLRRHQVGPLWKSLKDLLPAEPRSQAVPHVWRYAALRPELMRAGELVSPEEAERRVLMLLNPAPEIADRAGTTATLYAGLQLVLPGEVARAHHHAATALRFVIEASGGAYTTVNGERVMMAPGDLVLTPNWHWHDHGNDSGDPVIWLDGLDLPLVNFLEAGFFELYPDAQQKAVRPDNGSARLFTHGRLNPVWERGPALFSPVFSYPWREAERTLRNALEDTVGSPADGVIFEYANPYTGGPVMPTLSCFLQALPGGCHTQAHRHTTSVVYHVARGEGITVVNGQELAWREHDTFCVPGWAVHEHINASASSEAILFSYSNQYVFESLGLYREEAADRQQ
jgi:gentisate 1,2-dioxygenase